MAPALGHSMLQQMQEDRCSTCSAGGEHASVSDGASTLPRCAHNQEQRLEQCSAALPQCSPLCASRTSLNTGPCCCIPSQHDRHSQCPCSGGMASLACTATQSSTTEATAAQGTDVHVETPNPRQQQQQQKRQQQQAGCEAGVIPSSPTAKQKHNTSDPQHTTQHKPWTPPVLYSRNLAPRSSQPSSSLQRPSSLRQHLTAASAALMLLLTLVPSSLNSHLVAAQTSSSCKSCGPVSAPPPPPAGGTCNPALSCNPSQSLANVAGDPLGPPAVYFRGSLNSSTPAGVASSTPAGIASIVSLVGVPLQYTGPLTSWVSCYTSLSGALTLNATTKLAPIGNTVVPGVTAYVTPGSPFSATSGSLNSNGLTARSLNISFGQGPDAAGVPKMSGAGVRAVAFEFSSKPEYGSLRSMVRLCGAPGTTTPPGGNSSTQQPYGQYTNAGGPVPMPGLGPMSSTSAGGSAGVCMWVTPFEATAMWPKQFWTAGPCLLHLVMMLPQQAFSCRYLPDACW
jgi:hypothetical protein